MGTRQDKEPHVTSKDAMVDERVGVPAAARSLKVRRGTAAVGTGLLALAMAMTAPGAQANKPAAIGFASEDGVEAQMLTGPSCTWTEVDDDDHDHSTHRENVVCDNEDKNWWHAAPTIAAGPTGELTFRWDTDAQPVKVRPFGGHNDNEQPFPASLSISALSRVGDCKNPCTISRTDINSGGNTYVVEVQWGETSSTKYAVNLEG